MGLGELILTLLAASTMPLVILYLYEMIYNHKEEEEEEEEEEGD